MAELFHKTFVDAATGANGFDSVTATNGTVAQSVGAGLNVTSGGITITATGANVNAYGLITSDLTGKSVMRTAFWTDLSSFNIGSNNDGIRLHEFSDGSNSVSRLQLLLNGGVIKLRHIYYNDDGSSTAVNVAFGAFDWIELRNTRSSGLAVTDAVSQVYCGGGDYAELGELLHEITGISNYTRFEKSKHHLGMRVGNASVSGSLIVDEWTLRNDDTPILFGVSDDSVISRGMKYVLNRRRRKSYCW